MALQHLCFEITVSFFTNLNPFSLSGWREDRTPCRSMDGLDTLISISTKDAPIKFFHLYNKDSFLPELIWFVEFLNSFGFNVFIPLVTACLDGRLHLYNHFKFTYSLCLEDSLRQGSGAAFLASVLSLASSYLAYLLCLYIGFSLYVILPFNSSLLISNIRSSPKDFATAVR